MSLSEILGRRDSPGLRISAPPSLDRLTSASLRVHRRWPDVMPAPDRDREAIIREMLGRVRDRRWEGATVAGVVRAGRLAFDPELRSRADLEELRRFFCSEVQTSSQRSFVGAMFSIYLATWQPDNAATRNLAAALGRSRFRLPQRWSALLRRLPYLLDGDAAQRLARRMRAARDPWGDLIAQGIRDPHGSGLLLHAHLAFVSGMKPLLHQPAEAERVLGWLQPKGRKARIEGVAEALDALLAPWQSKEPPEKLRKLLLERLVSAYGDPRVRVGDPWDGMHPDSKGVMHRWLTGADIEFFLDVVSQAEESHMWHPRREFWSGLYRRGRIAAAWVAFCPEAAALAERLLDGEGGPSTLRYGRQTAGGGRSRTSLLIMKIGDSVVIEGSHSYKVQVFRRGDRDAPRLFEERYDCERIRLAPGHDQQAHHHGWQDKVERLIEGGRGERRPAAGRTPDRRVRRGRWRWRQS